MESLERAALKSRRSVPGVSVALASLIFSETLESEMADVDSSEVMTLKAKRKAMLIKIMGTFKRSSDPHPKHRRASLTRQIDLLDREIRRTRRQVRKANHHGQG
jgi:hypothetical protein